MPTRLPSATYDAGAQAEVAAAVRQHPGALEQFYGVELCSADPATPIELQLASNNMMLDYYRDLAEGCVAMRRCRLMLLGSGAAGKSSLASSLARGGGVGPGLGSITHGVEQRTYPSSLSLPPPPPPITVCSNPSPFYCVRSLCD